LIPVELAPQVRASLRAMTDRGTPPPRCDEGLGQGETRTSYRYQWTEDGRSILAEEVKNEIYDGATPYTTYVRGVIVEGDRGVLLTGRGDSALVIEG
jgi:hypothetical protein